MMTWIGNRWRLILSPCLLTLSLGSLFQLVHAYQTTASWQTKEAQTMASQDPDALLDPSPLSKEAKRQFDQWIDHYFDLKTRDFKKTVALDDLTTLKEALDQIDPFTKERYQVLYEEIQSKVHVQSAYNALFQDDRYQVFKEDVTPRTLLTINQQYFEYINDLYAYSQGQDHFAIRLYNLQQSLVKEVQQFNQALNTLLGFMNRPPVDQTLFIRQDIFPKDVEVFYQQVAKLQYRWPILNKAIGIADFTKTLSKANEKRDRDYKAFMADLKDRDDHYDALREKVLGLNKEVKEGRNKSKEEPKTAPKEEAETPDEPPTLESKEVIRKEELEQVLEEESAPPAKALQEDS